MLLVNTIVLSFCSGCEGEEIVSERTVVVEVIHKIGAYIECATRGAADHERVSIFSFVHSLLWAHDDTVLQKRVCNERGETFTDIS